MTVDEFRPDGAGHIGKLELVEGRVRAMSPASGTHALVQGNLAGLLWAAFRARKSPCRVGTEAPISPRIHADDVRAPDLAVTCAPVTNDKTFPSRSSSSRRCHPRTGARRGEYPRHRLGTVAEGNPGRRQ